MCVCELERLITKLMGPVWLQLYVYLYLLLHVYPTIKARIQNFTLLQSVVSCRLSPSTWREVLDCAKVSANHRQALLITKWGRNGWENGNGNLNGTVPNIRACSDVINAPFTTTPRPIFRKREPVEQSVYVKFFYAYCMRLTCSMSSCAYLMLDKKLATTESREFDLEKTPRMFFVKQLYPTLNNMHTQQIKCKTHENSLHTVYG